jgi:hypothetical protein
MFEICLIKTLLQLEILDKIPASGSISTAELAQKTNMDAALLGILFYNCLSRADQARKNTAIFGWCWIPRPG